MKKHHQIRIQTNAPPTVELDSEAHAAYVRFSTRKVARTDVVACDTAIVTVDLARDGSVIGVELVGVVEFTIQRLLEASGITASDKLMREARYIPAKRAEMVPA
jgi:uncharacterized protein YuzE